MKVKNIIQRFFKKKFINYIETLEDRVLLLTTERDELTAKLEAAEFAYNMLLVEYNSYRGILLGTNGQTTQKWCPLHIVVALGKAAKSNEISSDILAGISNALSEQVNIKP